MKEVSHLLRQAYADLLTPLTVEGVVIPVFDERVNPNATIPTYRDGKAYVLITDQNEVENTTNRNNISKACTISLDIVTKYQLNSGGKLASELISNEIQQIIRVLLTNPVTIAGFQVMLTRLELSRSFVENGSTETAYRKLLVFNHKIYEL